MMVDAKLVLLDEVGAGVNRTLLKDLGTTLTQDSDLAKAFNKHIKWDSESLEQYVKDLSKKVYYLQDQVSDLLVKIERSSMFTSLEARVPMLDHKIVEFALNLNFNLKINNGTQKFILKQLLCDYIPSEIMQRPKWGWAGRSWVLNAIAS